MDDVEKFMDHIVNTIFFIIFFTLGYLAGSC